MWHPPLSSACLMFAAVCLDASPPPSHHLVLGCVPSLSACLGSCLFPLRPAIDVDAAAVPWLFVSPPAPPHRHDGRGDTTGLWRFSRLCLLAPRLAISSVRSASDGDGGVAYSALWPSSVPPATRSLSQSDFLVALPSCRSIGLIASLPDHSTRGTGRGSLVLAACLCCSISPAIYLCWFCVLRRRWLSCLLGCRIMYVVDGVMR